MVAVIGDVHGCFHTLVRLYNMISSKYPDVGVFSVGDLVDRGRYSFETVDFAISKGIEFTLGNHEYMFYNYFSSPMSPMASSWIFNGNEATLASYSVHRESLKNHLDIISRAPLFLNLPDCFISHAGISAKLKRRLPRGYKTDLSMLSDVVSQSLDSDRGVLWTRDDLLNLGKLQVVGHTRQQDTVFDEDSNSIYIDTGACGRGRLTAVIVDNSCIIDLLETETDIRDLGEDSDFR